MAAKAHVYFIVKNKTHKILYSTHQSPVSLIKMNVFLQIKFNVSSSNKRGFLYTNMT